MSDGCTAGPTMAAHLGYYEEAGLTAEGVKGSSDSDEFTKTTLEDFAGRYIRLGLIETMDNVEDVMALAWTPVM